MEAKDPEGLVNLEPRGMVGMIYVGDHQTLLYYTMYLSCGPYGYGTEDFFQVFQIRSLCELLIPMSLKGFDRQDRCRGPLDILNI